MKNLQHSCLLFLVCSMISYVCEAWNNKYDGLLRFKCKTPQNHIQHILSQHDNKKEDRIYDLRCKKATGRRPSCRWTGYVNKYDEPFAFQCPNGGYISGMMSRHSNKREDRIHRYFCCNVKGMTTADCKFHGWTLYDKLFNFFVPTKRVLTGVVSIHSNKKEDRIFQFQTCKLMKRP